MINYSIYENSFVFADWDNFEPELETVELPSSGKLIVERISDNKVQIIKLISSNPSDFLKKEFQPGAVLKRKLHFE